MHKQTSSVEIEANTLEDAVKQALQHLKAKRDDVVVEVLREEEKGLFGMPGSKKAKIKATLKSSKK
jgi:spoIIIJ-associated protein